MQQGSGLAIRGDTRTVRGILLDLEGVVYVRDTLLPSSLDAISRIQAAGIPLKFITNTTRRGAEEAVVIGDAGEFFTPRSQPHSWRATVDESGQYSFAVAL